MNIFNLYKNYIIQNKQTTPPGPAGWKGLCFTAKQANSSIGYTIVRQTPESYSPVMYYSNDGVQWNLWDGSDINLSKINDYVCIKGDNPTGLNTDNNYINFKSSGKISASGNINSLLDNDDGSFITEITQSSCYEYLFRNNAALISAPELSATSISVKCYHSMFENCTSLLRAPELPATIINTQSYDSMFKGCTSLIKAPTIIPATSIATEGCYAMFAECIALKIPPALPATTLSVSCYDTMFFGCTSLETAPELPATKLYRYCYWQMFSFCSSLTKSPRLPAITLAQACYEFMFSNCTALNEIYIDYTGEFNSSYFSNWVKNVAQNGDFYYNGTDTTRGPDAIPSNWTIHTF